MYLSKLIALVCYNSMYQQERKECVDMHMYQALVESFCSFPFPDSLPKLTITFKSYI